jgi:hypothetical protein
MGWPDSPLEWVWFVVGCFYIIEAVTNFIKKSKQ